MTRLDDLRDRNAAFRATGGHLDVPVMPRTGLFVVTCLDPRVEPAAFLGLRAGDAMVVRNAGGRVTDGVLDDVAFIGFLAEMLVPGDGDLFEVAVVHHTQCGTGFLADGDVRRSFAQRSGRFEPDLAAQAVVDPFATVVDDVEVLRRSPQVSRRTSVSGHVLDLETGAITTVVPAALPVTSRT